jgi:polysaccharide export outer membrane protein
LLQLVLLILSLTTAAAVAADPSQAPGPGPAYRVQPGDVVRISVWREEELKTEVVVRPDGGISLPLAGAVLVAGRTVPEVEADIAGRLKPFIPEPVVTMEVAQAQGNRLYVLGQVNRPGDFLIMRPVDVMQALSMAGGTTPFAALNRIRVLRRTEGELQTFSFRYPEVVDGVRLEQNILLQAGDVVVVP